MATFITICFAAIILFQPLAAQSSSLEYLKKVLSSEAAPFLQDAKATSGHDGPAVYKHFVQRIAETLSSGGDRQLGEKLVEALNRTNGSDLSKTAFAWITHVFAREFYKDDIIKATSDLIRFRTFATDVPNRLNPEFIKQKQFLQQLASRLGLNFRDADGFVQEIWIGEADKSIGLMVHSDVQPVDEDGWSHDPWGGEVDEEVLWGRGAIDDKGPLAAIMYGMRSLLDSGLPLKKKIVLLVGTDEESANEDVSTYLQSHPAPDETIVVDSGYPVICAEKGWGGLWMKLPQTGEQVHGQGLMVDEIQSGYSVSIVPDKATAKLRPQGVSGLESEHKLLGLIQSFQQERKGANLTLTTRGDTLQVTALGKTVHSSVPATGHNALMDLLVFLDKYVQPLQNAPALMAKFAATYIGFELDGKSLGIAHEDDFMGTVTVAGNLFQTTPDTVMFMFNFRIPKGIGHAKIETELAARMEKFGEQYGVSFSDRRYLDTPLYTDPAKPFVQRLLNIYNSVTDQNRAAQSIGGGTYAKRIPNAVVFGPKMPDEEYLGHQPNENIKLSTLVRNIEILTHTLVEFGL